MSGDWFEIAVGALGPNLSRNDLRKGRLLYLHHDGRERRVVVTSSRTRGDVIRVRIADAPAATDD